jgi:hypothetical protein
VTGGRQALAALICAALFVTAFASAAAAVDIGGPLPHGTDNYVPINAGKLAVVAKWPTNLRGTGYQIELATTEPVERVQAVCKTGTSCRVTRTIRIKRAVEMSWKVTIYSKVGFPVGGFVVCLVGRT